MMRRKDLYLHEEIMLLALKDEKGTISSGTYQHAMGGAILAELLLRKHIAVDESKKNKKLVDVLISLRQRPIALQGETLVSQDHRRDLLPRLLVETKDGLPKGLGETYLVADAQGGAGDLRNDDVGLLQPGHVPLEYLDLADPRLELLRDLADVLRQDLPVALEVVYEQLGRLGVVPHAADGAGEVDLHTGDTV